MSWCLTLPLPADLLVAELPALPFFMKLKSQREKKVSCVKKKDFKRVLQVVPSDRWKLCDQTVVG